MGTGDSPPFVAAYTLVLFLAGVILLLIVWVLSDYAAAGDLAPDLIPYVVVSHVVMGAAAIVGAVLRLFRASGARVATRIASLLLILWIPTGTALFVWWLVDVRKREAP
ncbi:MAG: hypothetical protein V3T86_01520 [Planctomycetota bacterium]